MAYASNSFGGGCPPTYLVSAISSSAMTATFSDLTGWVEVDSTGAKTSQPLGTSGSFCIKLDYGLATEETVKCTSLNPSTGVITFAARGFDGTTAQAHSAGSASKLNVFPTETATDWVNLQATATTASTTAFSALSAANSKVASVTAADGTITVAGTGTAPTVKVGTLPYSQLSGTPSSLPPSGSAGGDLTGTYPNPTLAVNRLPLTGGTLTGALNGTSATFTGEITGSDVVPSGLTGATTATRYVGGTVNGAPASGTFAKGDFIIDQSGTIWVCTTAGTPGTWTTTISSHLSLRTASATVTRNETTIFSGSTASQTLTAPSSPIDGSTWTVVNKASVSVSLSFTPSMVPLGSVTGVTTYTISAGGTNSFVNYNGSQWYMVGTNGADEMVDYSSVALSAWGAASANVAMGSNKITGLANGTASTDAAAFGQIPLLTDSVSSTSTTTAATPNSVKTTYDLANAALPKSGGTMSGAIAMGSSRITGLPTSGASTDVARADANAALPNPSIHTATVGAKVWTCDAASVYLTSNTLSMLTGIQYFNAISIPYAMTISKLIHYQTTGAAYQATSPFYGFGIYDTSGNLLAQTGNIAAGALIGFTGLTGPLTWDLTASYSIAAGNYMIGFLYYTGTGAGTPVTPQFGRPSNAASTAINFNCPAVSAGKLDQRSCTAGSGRTGLYSPMSATPTAAAANFWVALA